MKSRTFKLLLAAMVLAVPATATSENLIRQTMLATGQQYDLITNDDDGSSISFLPMASGGASFELWARGSGDDTNLYFLDQKIAGHYLPSASVSISTEDWVFSWEHPELPPRTRADKPFTVNLQVSGMLSDPTAPAAAKQVFYSHTGTNYDETYTPNGNAEYTVSSFLTGNLSSSLPGTYTQLIAAAPTKTMGLETFTISTLTDETITESAILDSASVTVWPVSEAIIAGVTAGMEIKDNLPTLQVEMKDLYPWSVTYAQIYPGPEALGTEGTTIAGSVRFHDTLVPQNDFVTIDNWEDLMPTDGTYTIEVLTVTPFDNFAPERLAHVTITTNRKVKINGQVTTSEK